MTINRWLGRSTALLVGLAGLTACGDDDGSIQNQNQNQNRPVCGNGIVELGELCDFGTANSDTEPDGCRVHCRPSYCGDGVIDTGEVCDGSNLAGQDCTDLGEGFTNGFLACTASCDLDTSDCGTCPNGRREPGEDCDGDELAGEDCTSLTGDQHGLVTCTDGCTFDTSACHTCGDGTISGGEQCEGADLGGQTCVNLGYAYGQLACDDACHLDRTGCHGQCGNGDAEPDEACDGADFAGETCQSLGFMSGQLVCKPWCLLTVEGCSSCGDGVRGGDEECDGADLGLQTCATLSGGMTGGTLACSARCRFDTSSCTPIATCGDGVRDLGEQCDGADLGPHTCATLAPGRYHQGSLGCSASCLYDTDACERASHCGNGFAEKDYGEQCDGLDLGGESCTTLGFLTGTLGCRADCGFDVSQCYTGNTCGNGVREGAEVCDGNDLGGATCASSGYAVGPLSCLTNCTLDTSRCSTCGDGAITGSDPCDGADLGGETCLSFGFHGGTLGCNLDCSFDTSGCASAGWCGDGVLQAAAGEQCDGAQFGTGTCTSYLGPGSAGVLTCDDGCHVSTARCWRCGDGLCNYDAGEDYDGCPTDCAAPWIVTTGYSHTCVLKPDGHVWCWGGNANGELGDGQGGVVDATSFMPVEVVGLSDVIDVSTSDHHTCAAKRDGTAWCWGQNTSGQLGDTTLQTRLFPVQVAFLENVVQVSAGYERTCAVDRDGDVWCWGYNAYHELGDGTTQNRSVATYIASGFTSVNAASIHVTCGLRADATVACWGRESEYGELGIGNSPNGSSAPTPVSAFVGFTDVVAVDTATSFICVLRGSGEIFCAGRNYCGPFGNGVPDASSSTPVLASSVTGLVERFSVSSDYDSGNSTVHAILENGSLWGWGWGGGNSIGDAAGSFGSPTALPVAGMTQHVIAVSGQNQHACAIRQDGEVFCWGYNGSGEVSQPIVGHYPTPQPVVFP